MEELFQENQAKPLLIDGTGHISGRLAAVCAKLLLSGQFVSVVNCSEIVKSGKLMRNICKWKLYKKKTCNANPRHGPKHHRAPKCMFFKTVRGMVPRKKWKGLAALRRFKVYDGVPPHYFYLKKLVAPSALAAGKLKQETARVTLGELATSVGWTKYEIIRKFEERRLANVDKIKDHQTKIDELRKKAVEDLMAKNSDFRKVCGEINELELKL